MCGICGLISKRGIQPGDIAAVGKCNKALYHRGPDGNGDYNDNNIALAMRRLAIIDLDGADQPLFNEDKSIALIANGEIYNYQELQEQLKRSGHQLRTSGDCEAIVHLYEEFGDDCVSHLRGMFAFALWDSRKKRLLLARDRMGERPLLYYQTGDSILFASEIKALLASGRVPFELDHDMLLDYLHFDYIWEPETAIKGIRKLPAGHLMVVEPDCWQVRVTPYWTLEEVAANVEDPVELLDQELQKTFKLVSRSDVPIGVALSGGVDSSLTAAMASEYASQPVHALTVAYSGKPRYDERDHAFQVASSLGIEHHLIEISTDEVVANFPDVVKSLDEPIADVSAYGYYCLAQKSRSLGIPVLLYGHGADELCWGYQHCVEALRQTKRKAQSLNMESVRWKNYLFDRPVWPDSITTPKASNYLKIAAKGIREAIRDQLFPDNVVLQEIWLTFRHTQANLKRYMKSNWLSSRLNTRLYDNFFCESWKDDPRTAIIATLAKSYLQSNGLNQNDRIGMYHSVESRMPLTDATLAALFVSLQKGRDLASGKIWFRQVAKRHLDEELFNRPKQGFTPPIWDWNNAIFKRHGHMLDDGMLVANGIVKPKIARQLSRNEFLFSRELNMPYRLLLLEFWIREMRGICQKALVEDNPEIPAPIDCGHKNRRPSTTIFTIPKPFTGDNDRVQRNAIETWLHTLPDAEIILFGKDEGVAEICREYGLRHIPEILVNESGTPYVSDAFRQARLHAAGDCMLYMNADIMLCPGFGDALPLLQKKWPHFLAVGQRWNLEFPERLSEMDNWRTDVPQMAREKGELAGVSAIDYFIFTRGSVGPLRQFLVGRPGWDNRTLYQALCRQIPLVDITDAVTVAHQNHDYKHIPGGSGKIWDGFENWANWKMLGNFRYAFNIDNCNWALTSGGELLPKKALKLHRRIWNEIITSPKYRGIFMLAEDLALRAWYRLRALIE